MRPSDTQSPEAATRTTTPVPRTARFRLLLASLAALASVCLAYRMYDTLVRHPPPERLSLEESVAPGRPPPLPGDDRLALRERLQRVAALRAQARAQANIPEAHLNAAREAMRAGDLLSAREEFDAAMRLQPGVEPVVYAARGHCALQLGLCREAIAAYERVIAGAPDAAAGYIGLSRAQYLRGRRAEALRTLDRGTRAVPLRRVPDRVSLAREFEGKDDLPRALAEAEALYRMAPDDSATLLLLARLRFKREQPAEARALLERLVDRYPDNGAARRSLAAVVDSPLLPQRDRALTEHLLLQTVQRDPGDTAAYAALGALYQEEGRYRQAAYIYTRLLETTPDSAAGRLQLAHAYARLGDARSSAAQQQIAAQLLARDRIGERLVLRRTRYPTDPQARLALGRYDIDAGRFVRALVDLQAAYCLAPDSAETRRALAALYARLGLPLPRLKGGRP